MSNPKVTVGITSYNHEDFVSEAIESILNQTFQDFEIIITDYGSSDKTLKIVESFSDPRIKIFSSEENQGFNKALNNCIINSKGKYFAYISPINIWEHDKLEKQIEFLDKNPLTPAVFTKVKIVNINGKEIINNQYTHFDQKNRTRSRWLNIFFYKYNNCLCNSSFMIKRDVYEEIGLYNERMANEQDFDIWVRLCLKYNFHILNEKLTKFRIIDHTKNAVDYDPSNHIRSKFEKLQVYNHYLKIVDTEFFLEIFPYAQKFGELKPEMFPYFLARLAYETHRDLIYARLVYGTNHDLMQLWALETLYKFIQSKEVVYQLKKYYDFDYLDFQEMSAGSDFFKTFKISQMNEKIDRMDILMGEKDTAIDRMDILITEKDATLVKKDKTAHEKDLLIETLKNKNDTLLNERKVLNKKFEKITFQIEKLKSNLYKIQYQNNRNRSIKQRLYSRFHSLYILLNMKNNGFKNALNNIRGYNAIKNNNLLDIGYYLKNNMDVRLSGDDPILHYIYYGFKEARKPNPSFDGEYYYKTYKDTRNLNPLIHYSLFGRKEGRKTEEKQIIKKVNDPSSASKIQTVVKLKNQKKIDKLKIGYVLWEFPPFSQTFVMNELKWLVENNYDVKVFYKFKPDKEANLDFYVQSIQIKDANHLIEKIKEFGINIIHTHFAYPTCRILTYPASEKTGIPFTLSVHAQDIFKYENDKLNKIGEMGKSKHCKKIFVLGNFHYEYLVRRGVPEEKLMFMRQATKYKIETPININSPRFKRKIKNVITIARYVEKKGIDTFIDAAKILEQQDLVFKIYGYGPLEDDYQKQIDDLNLKNITIEGILDGDEVKKAYENGDIFVLPCRRTSNGDMDGMPTVIFEAMAYGIPVITTNISTIPEFVLNDYCGFVINPDEPKSLADKILYVKELDKNELNSILKHAQIQVQKSTSVEENVNTMIEVWNNNKIDIFIVTHQKGSYKDLKSIKEILNRIFKHTTTEFDLTIVDNDSDEDFKSFILEYAKKRQNTQLIFLKDNIMCGPASNIALDATKNKFAIYLCSNEAYIIKHGWERSALKYMKNHDDVGIAGALAYSPSYYDGKTYREQEFFDKFRNQEYIINKDDVKFKHVQGGVYILRREAYQQCGGFNPLLPQGYMDVEYSYYLQSCGWKLGEIPEWISLTKKTRPEIYAYLDEYTNVVHPLNLNDLNNIDYKSSNHCNICNGEIFNDLCNQCNSDSSERAIYRIIGKSDKPYRFQKCTLLLKHNSLHKKFSEKMFTLENTRYTKIDLKENLEDIIENLDDTDVLITNLEFNISNYKNILKIILKILNDDGLLVIQLSNDEILNNNIKEYLLDQTLIFDEINFISKKLTKNEFLVVESNIIQ